MSTVVTTENTYRTQHPYHVWESIHKIPELLKACQTGDTKKDILEIVQQLKIHAITKFILLGRGSSYYAALAVKPLMEKLLNIPISCHVTNEFDSYPYEECDAHTAVFFLSHSGKSEGDLKVVDDVKTKKAYTIAVTDIPESDLAKAVDQLLIGPGGKKVEHPATRTYSTAIYRMIWLTVAICQADGNDPQTDRIKKCLEELPMQIDQFMKAFEEKILYITELIKDCKNINIVGFGPNVANAEEAAMAFNQSTGIPSQGYEMENYIHGPIQALTPEAAMICLAPKGALQERMLGLITAAKIIGAKTILLAPDTIEPLKVDYFVRLPSGVPDLISPVIYMVPLWLIGYHLGLVTGGGAHPDRLSMDKPEFQEGLKYIMKSDKWVAKK